MKRKKSYTISDGKTVLCLQAAEEGGYIVTSPLDPELITEAENIEDAFHNAKDAAEALRRSRLKLMRDLTNSSKGLNRPHEPPCPRKASSLLRLHSLRPRRAP